MLHGTGDPPTPPTAKLAKVPEGTPTPKRWHIDRRLVKEKVLEALTRDGGGPRLVGLVGRSWAGKTTVASDIARSSEAREAFPDGVMWLTVNECAKERLPALVLQLARTLHERLGDSVVGCAPSESGDGVACVKQYVELSHGRQGLRCLVVADNVWEKEVVSEFLETGLCILMTTRNAGLVVSAHGEAVDVGKLSEDDVEPMMRRVAEVRSPDDAADLLELGVFLREGGRPERAEELLRRSLAMREAQLDPDAIEVAHTLHQLGACVREAGRPKEAERLLRRCLAMQEAELGPNDLWVADAVHQLGGCVREAGKLEEAERLLRRALAIQEAKRGPDDVEAHSLLDLSGCIREAGGKLEEAERLLRRCLVLQEAPLSSSADIEVAHTLLQLGECVRDAGRLDEAEELMKRSLAMQEGGNLEKEDVAVTLLELGEVLRGAGRLAEAEGMMRRCLAMQEVALGSDAIEVAHTLLQLGECVRDAGRLKEAEELLKRSLAMQEAKLEGDDGTVAATLLELSEMLQGTGRLEEAEDFLRRSLAMQEAKLEA